MSIKPEDKHEARRGHKHRFVARPADDVGRLRHDRSSDLRGRYISYRNFVKFMVNRKGAQGQAYTVFEHCESPVGWVLVRRVEGVVPR